MVREPPPCRPVFRLMFEPAPADIDENNDVNNVVRKRPVVVSRLSEMLSGSRTVCSAFVIVRLCTRPIVSGISYSDSGARPNNAR